jgi:nitroreductase
MTVMDEAHKLAKTSYPVLPEIAARWSPRAFNTTRPVEMDKLCSVLEAGRWAASSYNEQPWRFIVGNAHDNSRTHEQLQAVLVDGNRWAKDVPVLILAVAKNHFTQSGGVNRHAFHDVGLAMGNMALQATALGLHSHMMAGILADEAYARFNIPQSDYTPCVMMCLGYLGESSHLSEEWQRAAEVAERYRKPLQDIVFADTWEQPYSGCFT